MHSPRTSWASDLAHPLPLAAVALLALNDHALKGAGILPQAVTGKLSDVAGLFFFPLLLAAVARGASWLLRGRDLANRPALALFTTTSTGAVFALLKLHAPFNAFLTRVWGVNVMDPSDLFALPVLLLSAAFLLRAQREDHAAARPARRVLDLAAVTAAAIASIATSAPPPPITPPQPMAWAKEGGCASVMVQSCERSATQTFVVLAALGAGDGECTVEVASAEEVAAKTTPADVLPVPVRVAPGRTGTLALSFLRPVAARERSAPAVLSIGLRVGGRAAVLDTTTICSAR